MALIREKYRNGDTVDAPAKRKASICRNCAAAMVSAAPASRPSSGGSSATQSPVPGTSPAAVTAKVV